MDPERLVRNHFSASAQTATTTVEAIGDRIAQAAARTAQTLDNDGKILICGNGGSASDAQHFAADTDLHGLAPGHHAPRGRQNAGPKPGQDRWHTVPTEVDTSPRSADPLDARDDVLAARTVLQLDTDHRLGSLPLLARDVDHHEGADVALVLQNPSDLRLEPR